MNNLSAEIRHENQLNQYLNELQVNELHENSSDLSLNTYQEEEKDIDGDLCEELLNQKFLINFYFNYMMKFVV